MMGTLYLTLLMRINCHSEKYKNESQSKHLKISHELISINYSKGSTHYQIKTNHFFTPKEPFNNSIIMYKNNSKITSLTNLKIQLKLIINRPKIFCMGIKWKIFSPYFSHLITFKTFKCTFLHRFFIILLKSS